MTRVSRWFERAARHSLDRRGAQQQGQVAVLFAIAAVAIVVTAGLALDAGQSFVSQRALQAGADTAAQSGTSMLDADFTACVNSQPLPYTTSDSARTALGTVQPVSGSRPQRPAQRSSFSSSASGPQRRTLRARRFSVMSAAVGLRTRPGTPSATRPPTVRPSHPATRSFCTRRSMTSTSAGSARQRAFRVTSHRSTPFSCH
jgi:uncharacterized membrane protein